MFEFNEKLLIFNFELVVALFVKVEGAVHVAVVGHAKRWLAILNCLGH